MEFHGAANIFPLDEDHLHDLADDIREHGQHQPIEVYDGKILDGRRRWKACKMAGVVPSTIDVDPDDPVAYVLSLNLHRRHLTVSQAAMCAQRARKMYDDAAKERQKLSQGRGKKGPDNCSDLKGEARDQVGQAFGISGGTVDQPVGAIPVYHNPLPGPGACPCSSRSRPGAYRRRTHAMVSMNIEVECECCQAPEPGDELREQNRLLALGMAEMARELARVKRENRRLEAAKAQLAAELNAALNRAKSKPLCEAVREDYKAHQEWNRDVRRGAKLVGLPPDEIEAALFGREKAPAA